ncbi:MAG: hypothetical protein ACPGWR_01515 [Ardenticatenaceae bacterium]
MQIDVGTIVVWVVGLHVVAALLVPLLAPLVLRRWPRLTTIKRKNLRSFMLYLKLIAITLILWATIYTDVNLFPFKILLLLTLLNVTIEEEFPFSNYPMYYSFSERPYYIRVTNQKDEQVALREDFGVSADYLKRLYNKESKKYAKQRGCSVKDIPLSDHQKTATVALNFLAQQGGHKHGHAPHGTIKMQYVRLTRGNDSVNQETFEVGVHEL